MARQLGDSAGCQNLCPLPPPSSFVKPPPTPFLSLSLSLLFATLSPFLPASSPSSFCFSISLSSSFFFFHSNLSRCILLPPFDRIGKNAYFPPTHPVQTSKTKPDEYNTLFQLFRPLLSKRPKYSPLILQHRYDSKLYPPV